jgi:hypothetical protein
MKTFRKLLGDALSKPGKRAKIESFFEVILTY